MLAEATIRAPRADEAEAIAALLNTQSRALHGEDSFDPVEVRHWFGAPNFDPERNARVAVLADGTHVGFGAVNDFTTDHSKLFLFSGFHPEHDTDALADELFDYLEERAAELVAPGGLLHAFASSVDEQAVARLERRGYRLVRNSHRMVIELDDPPPMADLPDGFELRPYDPERDARAVFDADEEAFADHWGFVPGRFEDWHHWMTGERFDPSLWFIAYAGDEIAGFCICRPREPGDPDMGWVSILGVRPPWRRQGLASALLQHSFAEFYNRGRKRVGLGVDTENTTGAVALYERVGMRPVRRFDTWEKAL